MDPNTSTDVVQSAHSVSALGTVGAGIMAVFLIVGLIIAILFAASLFKTMKRVPKEYHLMPAWLCWLTIIPAVGMIFYWLMVPFGVPKSIRRYLAANNQETKRAGSLFGIGLAAMICMTLSWVPFVGAFLALVYFVLWVIYWVKVVTIRRALDFNTSEVKPSGSE